MPAQVKMTIYRPFPELLDDSPPRMRAFQEETTVRAKVSGIVARIVF